MNKQGQLKIQEMAFVLVALLVFFALVTLLFVKLRTGSIQEQADTTREEAAQQLALVLAATPELAWSACVGCIDLDKALMVQKEEEKLHLYQELWKLDYLAIERLYPRPTERACSAGTYPDCHFLTLINGSVYGVSARSFVSLCRRYDAQIRCELGVIYASGKGVDHA